MAAGMDLAVLGLEIRSDGVVTASRRLEEFDNKAASAEAATDKLSSAINKLAKLAAATFTAMAAYNYGKNAALAAARYETLGVVMEVAGRNAGYTAKQMRELEVSLQKQGISMTEARQNLARMAAANINLAKASEIARAAQDVAVVGNVNSSEAFTRLTRGIQSGEQEILKTIGLNVQWEAGYKKLAKEIGTTADALTEQQKIQSRTNTVLDAASKYTGIYEASMATASKQLGSMQRYLDDISVNLGTTALESFSMVIMRVSDNLKLMDTDLKQLAADGTLAKWGSDAVRWLTDAAGWIDNLVVALVLWRATTLTVAASQGTLGAALAAKIALVRSDIAAAGGMAAANLLAASAVGTLRVALLAVASTPAVWVVALGSALYGLWSTMQAGEAESNRLKSAFDNVGTAADVAADKVGKYEGNVARVMLQNATQTLENERKALEDAQNRLMEVSRSGSLLTKIASPSERIFGYEKSTLEAVKVLEQYRAKVITVQEAFDKLLVVQTKFGNSESMNRALGLFKEVMGAENLVAKAEKAYDSASDAVKRFSEAHADAVDPVRELQKALAALESNMKRPATAEDAVLWLKEYTKETDLAKKEQYNLGKEIANTSINILQQAAAAAQAAGDLEGYKAMTANIAMFTRMIAQVKAPGTEKSERAAEKQAKFQQSALDKVNELQIRLLQTQAEITGAGKAELEVYKLKIDQAKELNDLREKAAEAGKLGGSEDLQKATDLVEKIYSLKIAAAEFSAEWEKVLIPLRHGVDLAQAQGISTEAATKALKEQQLLMVQNNTQLDPAEKMRQQAVLAAEIATIDRNSLSTMYEASATLAERTGNYAKSQEYESKILALQIKQLETAKATAPYDEQRKSIEAQIAVLKQQQREADAYANMNIPELLNIGFELKATESQKQFLDFWKTSIPNAVGDASGAFADFFMDMGTGTKSAEDAWRDFGNALNNILRNIMKQLLEATIQAAIFGNAMKSVGGGGGGGLFGALVGGIGSLFGGGGSAASGGIGTPGYTGGAGGGGWATGGWSSGMTLPSAHGNVLSGAGISALSGSIVTSPTYFGFEKHYSAFAKGGVAGEVPGQAEGIFPLTRIGGDLGIKASFDGIPSRQQIQQARPAEAPKVVINPMVIDRTEKGVSVQQRQSQDDRGNLRWDIILGEVVNAVATGVDSGNSPLGRSLERAYGVDRATQAYRG